MFLSCGCSSKCRWMTLAIEQYFWRNLTRTLKPQMPIIDHKCNNINSSNTIQTVILDRNSPFERQISRVASRDF